MQRVNAHIQQVAVFIRKFETFLRFAVVIHFDQSHEFTDSVVYVRDVIANLQLHQVFQGQMLRLGERIFGFKSLITVKNLVVGINCDFIMAVHKALVKL